MTEKDLESIGWFSVGDITNYYGGIGARRDSETSKCYWSIENYDGYSDEEEIPEYLFKALLRYESERTNNINNK